MSPTFAVYRKEMRTYLVSPIPYVLVIILSAVASWWFFGPPGRFFLFGVSTLDALFRFLPWGFMLIVPAVTMRLWSEEYRGGTFETLLTFPARPYQLVLGKFLAAWTVVAFCLLATVGLPITAASLGDLDWGPAIGGYLGALLMGAAFLSLGQWLSGLTNNQIVAFLVGLAGCFLFVIVNQLSDDVGPVAEQISIASRFASVGRGVIDLRDVLYFASFCGFFLYVNCESISNRRYR